jgi:hypothetical protein
MHQHFLSVKGLSYTSMTNQRSARVVIEPSKVEHVIIQVYLNMV